MLSFLQETTEERFDRIASDIREYDSSINMHSYVGKTPTRISRLINKLSEDQERVKRTSQYGAWLNDDKFMARSLMIEGLGLAKELRESLEDEEVLIDGQFIYRDTMDFNSVLVGQRTYIREGAPSVWMDFRESLPVQKALEVIRFGTPEDFYHIYVETANGRPDALEKISLEHLRESSIEALEEIEAYCDSRWEGVWPWEQRTSYRVETMNEEKSEMRIAEVALMQARMTKLMQKLNEDDIGKYEIISTLSDMEKQVDSMITDVAKLSAAGIEAGAKAGALIDPSVGSQIEQAWQSVVNPTAQSLTSMKGKISEIRTQIETGQTGGMPDTSGGDLDMGTPDDAMNAMGGGFDDGSDDLADVPLDHTKAERDIKTL